MRQSLIQCTFSMLAMAFTVMPAAAEHPALTGVWHLDVSASNFGNMPPVSSAVLAISSNPHKTLHFSKVFEAPRQQRTEESDWRTDDHYHPVDGSGSGEILAKWQGDMLIGRRVTDGEIRETRFQLSPAGDSLTETIQSGATITTLIWRRH